MDDNFKSHDIPLPSSVFAFATNNSEPLFAAGLVSGHVYTYTWPKDVPEEPDADTLSGGYKVAWKTRRHKGSCRAVAFSHDGTVIYSAGTDGIIKEASSATGIVTAKALIYSADSPSDDGPTQLLPITPHHLLAGTDSGTVHLYDTRDSSISVKPNLSFPSIHTDYISSMSPLPPTAESTFGFPKTFITTGDSTLAYLDIRKGRIESSEDQEDGVLSSTVVSGVGKGGRSTRAYVGLGEGTIHAFERGVWTDMCERIKVAPKNVEVDCLVEYTGEEFRGGKHLATGCGDGTVRIVKLGSNQVVKLLEHNSENDIRISEISLHGVTGMGFDCDGAFVTAGGNLVKVWYQDEAAELVDNSVEDEASDGDEGEEDSDEEPAPRPKASRKVKSDSDDSDNGDSKSSKRRRKKQKNKHKVVNRGKASFKGLD